uniref:Uncharacterized protein n=1 Tax=Pectinophora gossypiella TaxID=13191 RepID=A0A1E1WQC0_PECGO
MRISVVITLLIAAVNARPSIYPDGDQVIDQSQDGVQLANGKNIYQDTNQGQNAEQDVSGGRKQKNDQGINQNQGSIVLANGKNIGQITNQRQNGEQDSSKGVSKNGDQGIDQNQDSIKVANGKNIGQVTNQGQNGEQDSSGHQYTDNDENIDLIKIIIKKVMAKIFTKRATRVKMLNKIHLVVQTNTQSKVSVKIRIAHKLLEG